MKITRKQLKTLIESHYAGSSVESSWSYWLDRWQAQFADPIGTKFHHEAMSTSGPEKRKKLMRFRAAMQEYIAALQQLAIDEGGNVDDPYDDYNVNVRKRSRNENI